MPDFIILCIKEHVEKNDSKMDNKLYILYDPSEEKFFCYGSRQNGNDDYEPYSFSYTYSQSDSLVKLLFLAMNKFDTSVTIEISFCSIDKSEYDDLDFEWFSDRLTKYNELSAYDMADMSIEYMGTLLDMLINE